MEKELKSLTLNGTKYTSFVDATARKSGGSAEGAVLYTPQDLADEQKAQARENIGSVGVEEFNALKSDIETALDNIISIQNKLIGGESV